MIYTILVKKNKNILMILYTRFSNLTLNLKIGKKLYSEDSK